MYAERAYFDGDHCSHCAARDEAARLARIAKRNREAVRAVERRTGNRSRSLAA